MEGRKVIDTCSYFALGMIQGTWYSCLVPGHCLKNTFWQKTWKETHQQLCSGTDAGERLSQCTGSVQCSGINSLLVQVSVLKIKQACYALNVKDSTCPVLLCEIFQNKTWDPDVHVSIELFFSAASQQGNLLSLLASEQQPLLSRKVSSLFLPEYTVFSPWINSLII